MIKNLSTNEMAREIEEDEYNNFTYNQAERLIEYLEEMEEETGETIEFDSVAIRCDFSASTQEEILSDYSNLIDDEDIEEMDKEEIDEYIVNFLQENTLYIDFIDGCFIYQAF